MLPVPSWPDQRFTAPSRASTMLKKLCLGLAIVLGLAAEVKGPYMLYSPEGWYFAVPVSRQPVHSTSTSSATLA